jgi:hypothetical protein
MDPLSTHGAAQPAPLRNKIHQTQENQGDRKGDPQSQIRIRQHIASCLEMDGGPQTADGEKTMDGSGL